MHLYRCLATIFTLLVMSSAPAFALYVSPPKDPIPLIKEIFPEQTRIAEKEGTPPIRMVYKGDELIGYAFETNDLVKIPAYSGEPVNTLITMGPDANYLGQRVLEHHEPIILAGIPEYKLDDFVNQYTGLKADQNINVGSSGDDRYVYIDGLSGATVTVAVMNNAIVRSTKMAAESLGLIEVSASAKIPLAKVKSEVFSEQSWQTLTGDGSIRRLYIRNEDVDEAFVGTDAEGVDESAQEDKKERFAEIYYTQLDIPTVGNNVLFTSDYEWLIENLKPNEHLIGVFGNGYSFKGSGYVRGGIFDRIQMRQDEDTISFRDLDQIRLSDIALSDAPRFKEMSAFIVREDKKFNPGNNWEIELLVRRQTGPIDSVFTSFMGDYAALEVYLDRPEPPPPERSLVEQIWDDAATEVVGLGVMLFILFVVLFFQDAFVRRPKFMHYFRHTYLVATVVLVGWAWSGQISIVNVFTFLHSLVGNFSWDLYLLDPMIFMMWCAAAVLGLLFGRAVYCGWLCPFGALQELVNMFARYVKIPQLELPYAVHERLWAIKYLILLVLFGVSLDSLALAEKLAEVEPFKTTFLLNFDREWPFVIWAVFLILINLFNRKTFCRYICPLGAALSVPVQSRLFSWLSRRDECGKPCRVCANECEIQAIDPNGVINMRECHYCLDCQVTYYDADKCPPLIVANKRKNKKAPKNTIPSVTVYE